MTRWRDMHADGAALHAPARGARFDVAVHAAWDARAPEGIDRARFRRALARQIRQDAWRALRTVRGFVPAVEVASDHSSPGRARVLATAGGRLDCRPAPRALIEHRLAELLADPASRLRWSRNAARAAARRGADPQEGS
ncbi:hypothetical protein [Oceanicella actignis]|uniref:hypothetical protein n=1 Tax=Oceanicella actignis TaxID=1189325 RepID=UPI0011E8251A|nr:hypothetical protein [Oceanicella actignis]TYO84627.1 hypothetical protein LY05_02924 [Oceanicella actignis]